MLTVKESRDFPGARPLDHRIALAYARGLSTVQIGDLLDLPREYVDRRLPAVAGMPIVPPYEPPLLQNRVLTLLRSANGAAVKVVDLVVGADLNGSVSLYQAIMRLRRGGNTIEGRRLYEMTQAPTLPILSTSRANLAIVERLKEGPAGTDELARLAGIRKSQVGVYVISCGCKGAIIEGSATYRLIEESQS